MPTTSPSYPTFRRQTLRLERGLLTADEFAARNLHLTSWSYTPPLTDAQWREIGRCNGLVVS